MRAYIYPWKRSAMALTLAVIVLIATACPKAVQFATELRVVLAAGAPVFSVLVQQGKISDSFRLKLVTDLNEEAGNVQQLGTCLDAAVAKSDKLQCIQTFEGQTRPVLERNFKTNQTVSFIADDVEAVIQAAIIFYGGRPAHAVRGVTPALVTERDIKARIETLKRDLGQK